MELNIVEKIKGGKCLKKEIEKKIVLVMSH